MGKQFKTSSLCIFTLSIVLYFNISYAETLWDQPISSIVTSPFTSQDFETVDDKYDSFIADDFTNSKTWQIKEIYIPGTTFNPGADLTNANTIHFLIYKDLNGKPAGYPDGGSGGGGSSPIWSLSVTPTDPRITLQTGLDGFSTNTLLKLNTPISLPPGTYWLVFYPQMDGRVYGQYGRHLSDTTNGQHAQLINPGGGFGLPTTWTSFQDTIQTTQQDFAFSLRGTVEEFPWELFYPAFIKKK